MKSFGKTIDLIIVFAAINIIPRVSSALADLTVPSIQHLDPDGAFLWISIHHIFQLAFTLAAMKLYFRSRLRDWGFHMGQAGLSLKIVFAFFIASAVYQAVPILIGLATGGLPPHTFPYPLTPRNIAGQYAFQGLLSGTCEEPLFRGFVMSVLSQSWKARLKISKIQISVSNLIAALLFTYAHIGFSLFPFAITRLSVPQLIFSFVFGIMYGIVFDKTKSILGPILLHNVSNINLFLWAYFI